MKERSRVPERDLHAAFLDVNCHNVALFPGKIKELLAVSPPVSVSAALRGDLVPARRVRKIREINLGSSRSVRIVCDPLAVRGEHRSEIRKLGLDQRERSSVSRKGKNPDRWIHWILWTSGVSQITAVATE